MTTEQATANYNAAVAAARAEFETCGITEYSVWRTASRHYADAIEAAAKIYTESLKGVTE
jgi:hypothetical protein